MSVGKRVFDELYIHLSAIEFLGADYSQAIREAIRAVADSDPKPNVAKVNTKSARLSLLAYPDFEDDPFPTLVASWNFAPGTEAPVFRSYADSLNPPILHRKELLVPTEHPDYARWAESTKTAEALGLFDETSTIGFRLNWQRLIASKGYQLVDGEFMPIGNDVAGGQADTDMDQGLPIQRHLTALARATISAPVQLLLRHGLLRTGRSFFDYGCGRGGDVASLAAEGYDAKGWDPHFAPQASRVQADIVNLGFVVNVIEDPAERIEALTAAFRLARVALAVGVMLYASDIGGRPFRDGYLSSRATFQKYFSQEEFKDYLEQVLHRAPFMVGPGVAFLFASEEAEQEFSANRFRSGGLAPRLLTTRASKHRASLASVPHRNRPSPAKPARREPRTARPSAAETRLVAARPQLDKLWSLALDLGRIPEQDDLADFAELEAHLGSLGKAQRMLLEHYDLALLEAAARIRTDDVRLLMAMHEFAKRPAYGKLESRLKRDVKAFFGDYRSAQQAGHRLLVEAGDTANVLRACKDAAGRGLGWLEGEHSLQLHISMVERLPAVLRAYVACGLVLWNSLSEVQLVKIHIESGKLTLMEYEGFDDSPVPLLRRRIKILIRRLNYEVFEYGSPQYPKPALYRKSRYLHEDYPCYAEQLAFDEAIERMGLPALDEQNLPPSRLVEMLKTRRLTISGLHLVPSDRIPELDSACGKNLTYRELIECGATQRRLGLPNLPLRPATYNALYDLASQVLDPVIEYFGSIKMTYGFASAELVKHITDGVAPKIDQHASCEHTARGTLICDRGGAACDFVVEDEDMREVADWIIENLPFDRLYFYGRDKPIHVSYSTEPAGQAFAMVRSASGRLMPRPYQVDAASGARPQ